MYTFFFAIFTYVVIIQLNVEANFQIDRVVRHSLLGQNDKLQAVRTHGDFFQFLLSDFNDAGEFDESTVVEAEVCRKAQKGVWVSKGVA